MTNTPEKRSVPNTVSKSAAAKPVAATTPATQRAEEDGGEYEGGGSNFLLFNAMPSVLTSVIFHSLAKRRSRCCARVVPANPPPTITRLELLM